MCDRKSGEIRASGLVALVELRTFNSGQFLFGVETPCREPR